MTTSYINREGNGATRTVTAMTARRKFGGLLDEVKLNATTILIERDGVPMAMLAPLPDRNSSGDANSRKLDALAKLTSLSKPTQRGADVQKWMENERGQWDR